MQNRDTYMKVEMQGLLYKDVREVVQDGMRPWYQFTLKVQRSRPYEYETRIDPVAKVKGAREKQEVSYDLVEVTYKYDNGSQLMQLKRGDLLRVLGYGALQPEYEQKGDVRKVATREVVVGSVYIPVTKFVVRAQGVTRLPRPTGVINLAFHPESVLDVETGDFAVATLPSSGNPPF